jgi:hypothetical protein
VYYEVGLICSDVKVELTKRERLKRLEKKEKVCMRKRNRDTEGMKKE